MDENPTPQEGMNPELEVEVTESTTEETGETQVETEEMVTKSQLSQALARAHKAEAELKKFKAQPKQTINSNPEEIEATVLRAQGMSDDLLKELKVIAQVRGKSLIETQSDPLFAAIKEQKQKDEASKKASLPASKGSIQVRKEKTFSTPGLSDKEFKEMWKQNLDR